MGLGLQQRNCALLCVWAVFLTAGCNHDSFRADNLPGRFRAPSISSSQQVDLSRISTSVGGNDRIQPGDIIEVTIVTGIGEVDEKSKWKLQVSDQGVADVPLVGRVQIAGLKLTDASMAIRDQGIQQGIYRNPRVTLQMVQRHTNSVTVLGAVEKPGNYSLPATNPDLAAALAAAGGLRENANNVIEVRHPAPAHPEDGMITLAGHRDQIGTDQPQVYQIDLAQDALDQRASLPLPDGAVVVVEKQPTRTVYVMGMVRSPGQVKIPPDSDMRLLDALASSGGRKFQIADAVTITRQHPEGGESILIKVSVRDAQRNSGDNIRLSPGDVVNVEETAATFVTGLLQNFVRFGFSAAIPGI
jgi:polysaccharide export outer membrane protein